MTKQNKYTVFVSYTSSDSWIAKQIELHIKSCGANTFLFDLDSDVGENIDNKIIEQIKKSKELFVLFTPASLDKRYIWSEIGAAWGNGIIIIAVLYGIELNNFITDKNNPNFLKSNNIINLNDVDKYFNQLKRRVKKRISK